jgi:uncharacterized protein YndB with AHSA1/START domain
MADNTSQSYKEDLVVVRILNAPVELVWQAWTDPKHVLRWWGPRHYTSETAIIDLRVGGQFIFGMTAPAEQGGQESFVSGIYQKIVPLERLEFTQGLSDRDGKRIDPAQMGMPPDFPKELYMTVVFKPIGSLTELTITEHEWAMGQMYIYSLVGMQQSIDKMAAALAASAGSV